MKTKGKPGLAFGVIVYEVIWNTPHEHCLQAAHQRFHCSARACTHPLKASFNDAGFNLIVTTDNVSSTPLADLNQITSILLLQHWLRGYNIIALLFSPNCWILTLNVTTLPCLLHQICSRCRRISLGLSLKVMSGFYVVVLLVCGWP